ncbi:MAG: peptidoglycan DD-metalloendopeptidase family protein [Gammaproteobacteria bacterium]|nr:peptidoglycan DD-metalloendopeptidase family protein [Gammaproteobacteria bacterium]
MILQSKIITCLRLAQRGKLILRGRISRNKVIVVLLSVIGLSACVSTAVAPLGRDLSPPATENQAVPRVYDHHTVRKGESMYAIATQYGLKYKQLAKWNHIKEPSLIHPGQMLRLSAPYDPVRKTTRWRPAPLVLQKVSKKEVTQPSSKAPLSQRPLPPPKVSVARAAPSKSSPKPLPKKTPQKRTPPKKSTAAKTSSSPKPAKSSGKNHATVKKSTPTKTVSVPKRKSGNDTWHWPSQGKLVRNFTQSGNRGLDISGRFGGPIHAAADGRVVYTGSGLRGYGKLIIIKHNAQYLSAYGNNDRMLVQEGNRVKGGQKIAEMGKDGANRAILHFEIRKGGKPVDPLRYLAP